MHLLASLIIALLPQDPPAERFPDQPQQDALHYAITLDVDVDKKNLQGHVDYTFAARAPLTTIRLDARHGESWRVGFTTVDGKALTTKWDDDAQCAVVTLPAPLQTGEQITFRANLLGTPVDGFYFQSNRYGEPLAFTDHYSIRARGWLPCEDNPTDRAKFSLQLDYPEGLEAVGFGQPLPADASAPAPPAGRRHLALACDAEIPPYMWALVVGPFARVHEDGDARLLDHFVYRKDVEKAKPALVHHAAWLQTMEKTFGPYSYGKYTTVQCPTRWGGFEAPGNIQLAESLFDTDDRGVGTLAHELVHMWFGDGVGYARWREVWLSEGFASYFGPWLWSQQGGPPLPAAMAQLRAGWQRSREGRMKTVRDDTFPHPDQALNANTYPKGAWVLHMLRGELGDDAFFAAIASYYQKNRGTSLVTADFVAAVEASSKTELSWFFDQWLDRKGCPELQVATGDDGITVTQKQPGDPYRFWLRLRWRDGDGKPQEQRVRIEKATETIAAPGKKEQLEVDPLVELLWRPAR